jgi:HEAT repeat protein
MSNHKLRFIDRSSGKHRPDLKRLIAYCDDADPEVRMRAIERLRLTKSFDRPDVFMMSAGDPDELVRIEALQALTIRRYAKGFLPNFISALSDRSELVAAYAADGLRVAATKSTRPLLERHLVRANGHARASILGALHTLGRRTALRELLALLRSSDYRVTSFVANLLPELTLGNGERRACARALSSALGSVRRRGPRETLARALSHFRPRA